MTSAVCSGFHIIVEFTLMYFLNSRFFLQSLFFSAFTLNFAEKLTPSHAVFTFLGIISICTNQYGRHAAW